jgi:type II secretory pathway pseudopilin PulG
LEGSPSLRLFPNMLSMTETGRSPKVSLSQRLKRALSLIELLIVCGIACALAAILTPVLGNALKQGQQTDDLQRMRQLGFAASLYLQETGRKVWSCADLVDARRVGRELCSSSADPTLEGYANIFRRQESRRRPWLIPKEYRLSFVGLNDVAGSSSLLEQAAADSRGWLIDISKSNQDRYARAEPRLLLRRGPFRRLLDDGAVVQRTFKVVRRSDGRNEESWCFSPHWIYADYPETYFQERCQQIWNPQAP